MKKLFLLISIFMISSIIATQENEHSFYDVENAENLDSNESRGPIRFSRQIALIATQDDDGTVKLWDEKGKLLHAFSKRNGSMNKKEKLD